MKKLVLIKPNEEYIDEILAYRQEMMDAAHRHFAGDSGLRKFEDIAAWVEQCRLLQL